MQQCSGGSRACVRAWLERVASGLNNTFSGYEMTFLSVALLIAVAIFRRWRHLFVLIATIAITGFVGGQLDDAFSRPRPYDVTIIGEWEGFAMPSLSTRHPGQPAAGDRVHDGARRPSAHDRQGVHGGHRRGGRRGRAVPGCRPSVRRRCRGRAVGGRVAGHVPHVHAQRDLPRRTTAAARRRTSTSAVCAARRSASRSAISSASW